ncbi:MAG: peptidoglycan-binding protein [bacterium]|nr:peptidoglycan-binding protein [bacterium]
MNKTIQPQKSPSRLSLQIGTLALAALVMATPLLASAETLYRQLDLGAAGSDVSALQTFLAQDATLYPQGLVTGYFGSLSAAAVSRFQTRNGIVSVGRVGPVTLAALNAKMGNVSNAVGDVYAPALTSVNLTVGNTVATVNWTTSSPSRGKMFYSLFPIRLSNTFEQTGINFVEPYISGTLASYDGGERTFQTATVSGLSPDTTYYYLVEALDASNNVSITLPAAFHTSR